MVLRRSLIPFLFLSLAGHLLILFLSWPGYPTREQSDEPIPVTFLPAPKANATQPVPKSQKPRTRDSRASARLPKRTTTIPEEISKIPQELSRNEEKRETAKFNKNQARGENTIVRRPLPTLKELLPSVTWSPLDEGTGVTQGAISLDSREPKHVPYLESVKRAINLVWDYPEPALRHGLQGKLVLEFTILDNGQLEGIRLIHSSGFSILDEEAMRAVQAASPFRPLPPWFGKRLPLTAKLEYVDSRLKYGVVP